MSGSDDACGDAVAAAVAVDQGSEAVVLGWRLRQRGSFGHERVADVTYQLDGQERRVTYVVVGGDAGEPESWVARAAAFHQNLAPSINTILQEAGQRALRVPRCFSHKGTGGRDVLVLDCPATRGFQPASASDGLDVGRATMAVQELARLHAASTLLATPDTPLTHAHPVLAQDWTQDWCRGSNTLEAVLARHIDAGVATLETAGGRGRAVTWLKGVKPRVLAMLKQAMEPHDKMMVLSLGDTFIDNIFFRCDSMDEPVDTLLGGVPQVRLSNPVTDLHAFLAIHLKKDTRATHLKDLLQNYHNTFASVVAAGGGKQPFTLKELQQEYRVKAFVGVMAAASLLDGEHHGQEEKKEQGEVANEEGEGEGHLMSEEERKTRFLDVVDEWVKAGVIS